MLRRWRKRLGRGRRLLRSRLRRGGLILFYHRVAERDIDPFEQCLPPDRFANQLEWLSGWGEVLTIGDMCRLASEGRLPRRSIALTFDDGYADNFNTALPMLQRFGFPATFFIATGNAAHPFWWDILSTSLLRPARLPPTLPVELGGQPVVGDRLVTLLQLHSRLLPLRPEEQRRHLRLLADWAGTAMGETADRAMNEAELKELAAAQLATIGAHTQGHVALAAHEPDYQERMIAANKSELETLLGRPIDLLSYPYGLPGEHFNEATERIAATLGFKYACATHDDVVAATHNAFALPRLWVQNWTLARFKKEIKLWLGS